LARWNIGMTSLFWDNEVLEVFFSLYIWSDIQIYIIVIFIVTSASPLMWSSVHGTTFHTTDHSRVSTDSQAKKCGGVQCGNIPLDMTGCLLLLCTTTSVCPVVPPLMELISVLISIRRRVNPGRLHGTRLRTRYDISVTAVQAPLAKPNKVIRVRVEILHWNDWCVYCLILVSHPTKCH